MKCWDTVRNTKGEGSNLGKNWRWGTKVRVATGIRYPISPNRKRWILDVREINLRVLDNSLSIPPEYYERKLKIQNNWRSLISSRGSMKFNLTIRENLTKTRTNIYLFQVLHGRSQLVLWNVILRAKPHSLILIKF